MKVEALAWGHEEEIEEFKVSISAAVVPGGVMSTFVYVCVCVCRASLWFFLGRIHTM